MWSNLSYIYKNNKGLIRNTLFILGLIFLLVLIWKNRVEVESTLLAIDVKKYVLSIVLGVICSFVFASYFSKLLRKYGVKISEIRAIRLYIIGQIAKYIPGKFWGIAYQVSYANKPSAAIGILIANFEMMIGAIYLTFIVAILCYFYVEYTPLFIASLTLGAVGFLVLYKSRLVYSGLCKLLDIFGKSEGLYIRGKSNLNSYYGIVLFLLFISSYTLSAVFMLASVCEFSFNELLVYISILCLSWVGGVLVFIVPHGIGVREVIFITASSYIDHSQSVDVLLSIALLGRISQVVQELVSIAIITGFGLKCKE